MTNAELTKLARRCVTWGEDYEVCDACPYRQTAPADALEREAQHDKH